MNHLPGAVRRSGGPRSSSGKAKSAANAMKFGVYSRMVFLPNEDTGEFEQLHAALFADLLPQTTTQHVLAEEVLKCIWKKHRLDRLESEALRSIHSKPIDTAEWRLELGEKYERTFEQAQRFDDRIAQQGIDYYNGLLPPIFEAKRLFPRNCGDLDVFKHEHAEVYKLMQTVYLWPKGLDEEIIANKPEPNGKSFWESMLKQTEEWILDKINIYESVVAIEAGIPKIIGRRLYRHLKSEALERATDSVTQALSRALAEYYKERDRHRKETAVLLPKELIAEAQIVNASDGSSNSST